MIVLFLSSCIAPDNKVIEGTGTPDVTQCSLIKGVGNGKDFEPQKAIIHGLDRRTHPDLFYIAWANLDQRTDLRFPAKGYHDKGFEDKLLVSRRNGDGQYETWQIWPKLDDDCKDTEKVRIHSFDVAPDGKSLFISMSREEVDNPDRRLGIYRLDVKEQTLTKISQGSDVSYLNPTYIGNDANTGREILLVAKTIEALEMPMNYKPNPLLDEYDRDPTPLIHRMDAQTGDLFRIGLNNSHQTEPIAMEGLDGKRLIVFTQWEHQDSVNRFALWKMQIDGSDNFTIFGEESSTDKSSENIFQPRVVKSGPYQGYLLMAQNARTSHPFASEGHVLMTKRAHFDLRSDKVFLQKVDNTAGDRFISRNPEHYNDQSFTYSYRESSDHAYKIYVKDYPQPENLLVPYDPNSKPGEMVLASDDYHFVQPRSFYPHQTKPVAPAEGDIGQSRVSFTNKNLNGKAGFLVQNLKESQNGVQHQLNGIAANDLRVQFFIPSHTFSHSKTISLKNGPEMSIPASGFIAPDADGSVGVVLKEGLYTWKVNKRFVHNGQDIWIPIRAERQEVSFVRDRVNACNQCHQERSQTNVERYANYNSTSAEKMKGNLSNVIGSTNDISTYNATAAVPSFHGQIVPLLAKPSLSGGQSCMGCHGPNDKLNLSNKTGVSELNATYRNLLAGAHVLPNKTVVPFVSQTINPMGMDDKYGPAPFLWSLLLNDDLSVPSDPDHQNAKSRNLDRTGDYGASYNSAVEADIATINAEYNHSQHWSAADIQAFITYGTTQSAVGLSDRIGQYFQPKWIPIDKPAAQKAYQAMVRNCFNCHTGNLTNGIDDADFGLPLIKRFTQPFWLSNPDIRFVMKSHLEDTTASSSYSSYPLISDLRISMDRTMRSALHRIDFNDKDNSELLVYARGGAPGTLNGNVSSTHPALLTSAQDYIDIENWVKERAGTPNQLPTLTSTIPTITIREYDDPAFVQDPFLWEDTDDDGSGEFELSQLLVKRGDDKTHVASDTFTSLQYADFTSAQLQTYAILGDRGSHQLTLTVTDGLTGKDYQVPVTITSDYTVPPPLPTLPNATAFYTVRATGQLRKLQTNGDDVLVGTIPGYNGATWTTVYRRADKGWLYFVEQEAQKIHVVDEANANKLFSITLNHEPNRDSASHKQTLYLIWWRPAEKTPGDPNYRPGQLEGLLESKLSRNGEKDGHFYMGLGDGEPPISGAEKVVVPQYRTLLPDGKNTVAVYVWKRATFMSKWNNSPEDDKGLDRLNVLNLVTGKPKPLASYRFVAKTANGVNYPARDYINVRAIAVSEDGAFYGFNKDLNKPVEIFNFDPISEIQQPVTNTPSWVTDLINNPVTYATPFVVIDKR
ncbi:MAG: hypothetical protein AAB035_04155 [Nitrospirota bacterium]